MPGGANTSKLFDKPMWPEPSFTDIEFERAGSYTVTPPDHNPEIKFPLVDGRMVPVSSAMETVPAKPVATLLRTSSARTESVKGTPATWSPTVLDDEMIDGSRNDIEKIRCSRVSGSAVHDIVTSFLERDMVTVSVLIPAEKAPLVVGEMVPVASEITTVPVNPVAMLP